MFLPSIFLPRGLAVCAQTPTKAAEPRMRSRVDCHPNHGSREAARRREDEPGRSHPASLRGFAALREDLSWLEGLSSEIFLPLMFLPNCLGWGRLQGTGQLSASPIYVALQRPNQNAQKIPLFPVFPPLRLCASARVPALAFSNQHLNQAQRGAHASLKAFAQTCRWSDAPDGFETRRTRSSRRGVSSSAFSARSAFPSVGIDSSPAGPRQRLAGRFHARTNLKPAVVVRSRSRSRPRVKWKRPPITAVFSF